MGFDGLSASASLVETQSVQTITALILGLGLHVTGGVASACSRVMAGGIDSNRVPCHIGHGTLPSMQRLLHLGCDIAKQNRQLDVGHNSCFMITLTFDCP